MYFLLFLLIAMMIMMVVITTTNENKMINKVINFLTILVLIGGVCFLKNSNYILLLIIKITLCGLIVIEGVLFIFSLFSKNNIEISTIEENISLTKDELENFVLVSETDQKINKKTEVIVVTNNVVLKKSMFTFEVNIDSIKKIYFLASNPAIDSHLYEMIKNRVNFFKATESVSCFIVKDKFYIIGDISKDFVSMSETDDDGIYVYEFTYNKGMTTWGGSNGTIKFLITEGIEWNKKITGIELKSDFLDSLDNDLNATATGLIDGKTYIITLKETNGIFSAKIEEKKS